MVKTVQLGKVEPELNEKLVEYANLIGLTKIELLEEIITNEIEKRILTNDFINIKEIFYFNFKDLLKNKIVKTSKVKPTTNLKDVFIIKKIPNNLDVFNKDLRTFCYNGIAEKHLGIYFYNRVTFNSDEVNFFQSYYILFEYDSKTEELILKLTNPDEIPLLFNVNNVEKMISDLLESDVKKLPDEPLFVYLVSILVIQPLADAKNFSHHLLKESPEIYEKLKGRFSSEDLVLFPEFKVSDDKKHIVLPKTIEGGSNMKK